MITGPLEEEEPDINASQFPKYYVEEVETKDREELEALQLKQLKWQVNRCYQSSEFYRERFDEIGLNPGDIKTLEDLTMIPPVTKQELRDEQLSHPPFGRYVVAPQKDWRELHPSTGTTGTPVNTIWTERDVENITQWTIRTMWSFGTRPGDIVQNGFSYGLWVAGMSTHYVAKAMGCFVLPIGASMAERQVDYLLNPGSTVLLSTPSFALYIAERMNQRGIDPSETPLRIGCFGGEAGAEIAYTREKIETRLGIEAYDYYGLAEIGPTCASGITVPTRRMNTSKPFGAALRASWHCTPRSRRNIWFRSSASMPSNTRGLGSRQALKRHYGLTRIASSRCSWMSFGKERQTELAL